MSIEMRPHHFLLVCAHPHSHINPMLRLGRKLTSFGARVTFSIPIEAHRHMFPDQGGGGVPFDEPLDPLLTYHPYSNGYDEGRPAGLPPAEYVARATAAGSETLYTVATSAARPAPITCVIYTLLVPWAADVARRAGVPSVFFWIQPAALFAVYYHYFHDYRAAIDEILCRKAGPDVEEDDDNGEDSSFGVELPGLPRLRSRDLPSLITATIGSGEEATDGTRPAVEWSNFLLRSFEHSFRVLDEEHSAAGDDGKRKLPKVLANTFYELEVEAIQSLSSAAELVPIGPMLPPDEHSAVDTKASSATADPSKPLHQDGVDHIEWLSRWPDGSVVYLSFGTLSQLGRNQLQELAKGMVECGKPFLWILRGDSAVELKESVMQAAAGRGRTASWCDQVHVLQHPAVGCFITHCGWNSVTEALAAGVPMVAMPFWTDQPTNARLMTAAWQVGVTAKTDGEGVVRAKELQRCIELVMGDGQQGAIIRRAAAEWKGKAAEAVKEGGSSGRNLKSFLSP